MDPFRTLMLGFISHNFLRGGIASTDVVRRGSVHGAKSEELHKSN
jgi:hypothetical protein